MSEFVRLVTDDIDLRGLSMAAREEFIENCIKFYGMVPFNKEYLDHCWPRSA